MKFLRSNNKSSERSQMGRLTIFSNKDCAKSTTVKNFISENGIFFVEIDLAEYPERLKDLKLLNESNDKPRTPQLFCNNQHLPSSVSQLQELFSSWQNEYGTISAGYEASLKKYPCYHDVRLRLPCHLGCTSVANRSLTMITLPNPQRRISLVQVSRYLIKQTPNKKIRTKKKEYRRSFLGKDLLTVLKEWLQLNDKQTKAFGWQLMDYGIVLPLEKNVTTIECDSIYRLHAFDKPSVLNWSFPFLGNSLDTTLLSPNQVLLQLCQILEGAFQKYEENVHGMLQSPEFEYFEEAVSTLQNVCLPVGDSIFLINLFNLVVRHALIACNKMGHCWQKLLGQISYQFQDTSINLNEIKARLSTNDHGKRKFPNFVCFSPLQTLDPRYQLLCSNGTDSYPTIRTYVNETDIDNAVRDFVQQEIQFHGNELRLPQVFATFFPSKQDLMEWLIKFLDGYQLRLIANYHDQLVVNYNDHREWTQITDNSKRAGSSGSVTFLTSNRRGSLIRKMSKSSTLKTASFSSNLDGDVISQHYITKQPIKIYQ